MNGITTGKASTRRRATGARRLASGLVALVALGSATGCFDEVDGEGDERDINDTEVLLRDAGDMETGPADMAVVIDMAPEVDADLRPCQPEEDGGECTVGLGECEASGRKICQDGMFVCDAVPGEPKEELCNGVDDDCDGNVDELLTERCYDDDANGTAGVGRCVAGVSTCAAGEWGACEGQIVPGDETCDGSDEDCDGAVDEVAPRRCYDDDANGTDGVGVCTAGLEACVDGGWGACEGQVVPAEEVCDGADRDCDGAVDEVAPRRCYDDDENGTAGVGRCVAGTESCVDGGWGPCEGQILPGPETCDGTDENCDGRVDVGPDPDAPDQQIGVCGELVADHCRLWMGWTRSRILDPREDMSRQFDSWFDCPDAEQSLEGDEHRCTNTFFDRQMHTLPMPAGHIVSVDDKIGMRWHCPGDDAPEALEPILATIAACQVTLGERYTPGDLVQADWPPCDADGMTQFGTENRYRCTTTQQFGRWRALDFGRTLGQGTAVSVAFRCLGDEPVLRSIEQQTAVWFGWAPRSDGEVPADGWPWAGCRTPDAEAGEEPLCVSTLGDGRFHAVPIVIGAIQPEDFDPGVFGIGVRPVPVAEEGAQ